MYITYLFTRTADILHIMFKYLLLRECRLHFIEILKMMKMIFPFHLSSYQVKLTCPERPGEHFQHIGSSIEEICNTIRLQKKRVLAGSNVDISHDQSCKGNHSSKPFIGRGEIGWVIILCMRSEGMMRYRWKEVHGLPWIVLSRRDKLECFW